MIIYKPHQVRSVGDPKVWRWTWRSSWPSLSCQSAKTRWGVSPRMNGQWPASIRSKIILPPVTCSDSKITIYQLSAFINGFFVGSMGWNFKTLEKKAGILDDEDIPRPKKVKSLGSKWIFSQGSWGDTLQGFIFHGYKNEAWVWLFQVFSGHRTWRSWVLKSSTKENMTWSRRTNSGGHGGFFYEIQNVWSHEVYLYSSMLYCNHLTSSWDLGPSSSTLKLTYIHLSNLAHLTMSLRASVNISEEMTQCSRILAHFGTIVGSVACRKTIKTWWCPRRSVDRTVPVPWQKKNQQEWRFWYQNGEPVFFCF